MLELHELKELHDKAYEKGYDTRLKAADDMLFAWVTQWDDTYLSESDLGYRGEFNILRKAMRHIMADLINNPIQVDFDPVDDTDESGAEIADGMYRSDMRNNVAQEAVKNCNQEAVVCGVGAWELRNEYKTRKMGDERQVIRRHPIFEANNTVMWDPNAKLIDKSDADYVSVLEAYSPDGYKKLRKELTGRDEDDTDPNFKAPEISYVFPWINESKQVYVTRFFHRELKKVTYLTLSDSFGATRTMTKEDALAQEDDLADLGFDVVSEKQVRRYVVTRYIASGSEILEAVTVPGEHIPVIPQYGERQFVEGEEHYEGIVRLAKDPQRLRNFQMSYLADIVSRSPREKPIFTAEQLNGYEDMYELSGAENNLPYLKQNSVDINGNPLPVGPVGYIKSPDVPVALTQMLGETRAAVDDVASPGLPQDIADTDLSGKAVVALQKRLDMQSYTYQDNHKYAQRRDGEVWASMASDVYIDQQEVTLVRVDGSKSKVEINKPSLNLQTMATEIANDVASMMFDVYADIGPAFESIKQQNKEEIKELINGLPPGTPQHTILLNEYLTMVEGSTFDDMRDYARKQLIMMGVKKPETEEEMQMIAQQQSQQGQPDANMVLAQAEMLKAQADMQEQQNKAAQLQLEAQKVQQSGAKVQIDAEKAVADIEETRSSAVLNIAKAQQASQQTAQQQIEGVMRLRGSLR